MYVCAVCCEGIEGSGREGEGSGKMYNIWNRIESDKISVIIRKMEDLKSKFKNSINELEEQLLEVHSK